MKTRIIFAATVFVLFIAGCTPYIEDVFIGRSYSAAEIYAGNFSKTETKSYSTITANIQPELPYARYIYLYNDSRYLGKIKIMHSNWLLNALLGLENKKVLDGRKTASFQIKDDWNGMTVDAYLFVLDNNKWKKAKLGSFIVEELKQNTNYQKPVAVSGFRRIGSSQNSAQILDTIWGRKNLYLAKDQGYVSWYTHGISADDDNGFVTFVFRGYQFGSESADWYVNGVNAVRSVLVSKNANFSSGDYKLEYIYEKSDAGTFYLTVPARALRGNTTEITVYVLGDSEFGVFEDQMDEVFFDAGKPRQYVYGFDSLTYCMRCDLIYNSAFGLIQNAFAEKGQYLAWKTTAFNKTQGAYAVFYWHGSHYGGNNINLYVNSKYALSYYANEGNFSATENGIRLDFVYNKYLDGYNGVYYLYVPVSILKSDYAEISEDVAGEGWVMLNLLKEKQAAQLSNCTVQYTRLLNMTYCPEYCSRQYPSYSGWINQSWCYNNEYLEFSAVSVDNTGCYTVFRWKGSSYGSANFSISIDDIGIIDFVSTGHSSAWINNGVKLAYSHRGFFAGNSGDYELHVPVSEIKSRNPRIRIGVHGSGWYMIANQ